MDTKHRQALGRGLDALLGGKAIPGPQPVVATETQPASEQANLLYINPQSIQPNPRQPRQEFDSEALGELADSIRQSGLIQPLVVRQAGGAYQLVAGERRWRACKQIGLTQVPVVVTELSDEDSLLVALVENLQREDLNAIDESEAYARLRQEFGLSQEAVAERVGKSRVAVANSLRLLNLPRPIQEDIRDGTLSAGHGRALLSVPDAARREALWKDIKAKGLSVREAESRGRTQAGGPRQTSAFTGRPPGKPDPHADALEQELMARLGCRITIRRRTDNSGRVELHYSNLEEFDKVLEVLGMSPSQKL
jgi:ParB family chromosome partitioning protein